MNMPAGTDEAKLASGEVLVITTPAIPGYIWAICLEKVCLLINKLFFGCQKW